jgi:anti-sigma regulatory factor (Ser/Thr protein kinase)
MTSSCQCGEHLATPLELTLSSDPSAPNRARAQLGEFALTLLDEHGFYTAMLLTSELVTNALLHGGGKTGQPIQVRASATADRIRIEVIDAGPGFDPTRMAPDHTSERAGYGLILLERSAERWGVEPGQPFSVWFELAQAAPRADVASVTT